MLNVMKFIKLFCGNTIYIYIPKIRNNDKNFNYILLILSIIKITHTSTLESEYIFMIHIGVFSCS